MKNLKFKTWAKEFGINKLSQKVGVSAWSIRKYMRGECVPRIDVINAILKLCGGTFTMEELILESSRNKAKK